jgi:16S rRNA (cytidine1402-2'-O)-methyltransferase
VHEEVRRGPAAQIASYYEAEPARGEVVLVIGAAPPGAQPDAQERAVSALRAVVAAGARARPAAKALAELTGIPANRLYGAVAERAER